MIWQSIILKEWSHVNEQNFIDIWDLSEETWWAHALACVWNSKLQPCPAHGTKPYLFSKWIMKIQQWLLIPRQTSDKDLFVYQLFGRFSLASVLTSILAVVREFPNSHTEITIESHLLVKVVFNLHNKSFLMITCFYVTQV